MNENQINLLPGFEVLEFAPGYTVLTVPSGFTLRITRLPPFMFDVLERDGLKDPGPFMLTVKLLEKLKPPGIEQIIIYDPPEEEPDKEKHEQAWVYYQQWRLHNLKRMELETMRGQERWNLAILNCIEIVEGPIDVNDEAWIEPLRYLIKDPESFGERLCLFLKMKVILPVLTRDVIDFLLEVEEVTLEGLKQAFDSFWSRVQRKSALGDLRQIARIGRQV